MNIFKKLNNLSLKKFSLSSNKFIEFKINSKVFIFLKFKKNQSIIYIIIIISIITLLITIISLVILKFKSY